MVKNKLLGNIASLGIVQIANYLFPLITIPIVSRVLGPEKIGIINYATSFVAYFVLLVSYSFNFTGVRRLAKDPLNVTLTNKVFSEIFYTQCFLFAIAFIIYALCVQYFFPINLHRDIAWFTFLNCLGALFTQTWLFQARQDLKFVAILNIIPRIIITFFVIFCIKNEKDYKLYAFLLNIVSCLIALISLVWAIKKYKLKLYWVNFNAIKNILKEDRLIFFSGVITTIYTSTGVVILGRMMDASSVGYYTSAQKLVDIARNIILVPLNQAVFPVMVQAFFKNRDSGMAIVKKYIPIFILFTVIVLILMELTGPIVIKIFFGNRFLQSIPIYLILNFGLFFVFYGMMFGGNVMLNMEMDKEFVNIQLWVSVFSLILTFILVPKYGAIGTAFIWTISELVISSSQFYMIRKNGYRLIDGSILKLSAYTDAFKQLKKDLNKR